MYAESLPYCIVFSNFIRGFIAQSWHVTSHGMFAGSCIGVILLVMSLEFLRRASKEYDRYILTQAQLKQQQFANSIPESHSEDRSGKAPATTAVTPRGSNVLKFRPHVFQQLIRAGFHAVQFAVAYFVMLLAMHYNGYIIISIIIGAFLGAFVFSWVPISLG
jgi:solute carrier family 31 (copper transporter), member 1